MNVARSIGHGTTAVLKSLAVLLFTVAGGALVALCVYDLVEFEPRRAEIRTLIESAAPSERSPPPLLRELQRADARGMEAMLATRVILGELDRDSPRMRTFARMRRQLLWLQLVKIHLSEDEQLVISSSRAFMGQRTYGFEAGALGIFGRSLDRLSDHELAELVVIARWPSRFRRPERRADLAEAASALLGQVRNERGLSRS